MAKVIAGQRSCGRSVAWGKNRTYSRQANQSLVQLSGGGFHIRMAEVYKARSRYMRGGRRFLTTWSLMGAALLIAACAQPEAAPVVSSKPPVSISQEIRPLTEQELQQLFSGLNIREVTPPGMQNLSTLEQFNKNGTYVRYADNREIEGRYTIKNDRVCVRVVIHPEYCRSILVDAAGRYYKASSPDSDRQTPIIISYHRR